MLSPFRIAVLVFPLLLTASEGGIPAIGNAAPPLKLKQIASLGSVPSWENLRATPVVLEFWAPWCAPCVNSIPHLNELASQFKNVRFISITNESPEQVQKFLANHPIEGLVAFDDDGATHSAYGVSRYPFTALVDQSGILRGIVSPSQLTGSLLNDLAAGKTIGPQELGEACSQMFGTPLRESKSGGAGAIEASPGRWRARNLPLKTILAAAYSIPETNIVVPDAVVGLRYDMSLRVSPPGVDVLPKVRSSLEFGLKMHREIRETGKNSSEVLIVDSLKFPQSKQ